MSVLSEVFVQTTPNVKIVKEALLATVLTVTEETIVLTLMLLYKQLRQLLPLQKFREHKRPWLPQNDRFQPPFGKVLLEKIGHIFSHESVVQMSYNIWANPRESFCWLNDNQVVVRSKHASYTHCELVDIVS